MSQTVLTFIVVRPSVLYISVNILYKSKVLRSNVSEKLKKCTAVELHRWRWLWTYWTVSRGQPKSGGSQGMHEALSLTRNSHYAVNAKGVSQLDRYFGTNFAMGKKKHELWN